MKIEILVPEWRVSDDTVLHLAIAQGMLTLALLC